MKKYQTFGFLASIVFAVGMLGLNVSDGTFDFKQADSTAMMTGAGIQGHVEAIHRDSDGNIVQYLQTDNAITNLGINCGLADLFGVVQASIDAVDTACATTSGDWNNIGLYSTDAGTGGDGATANVTSDVATVHAANGLTPAQDTATTFNTVSSGDNPTSRTTNVEILIDNEFTASGGCAPCNVYGASLLNGTATTSPMFAFKDFNAGGTPIALNDGDSLTVNWQIGLTSTTDGQ